MEDFFLIVLVILLSLAVGAAATFIVAGKLRRARSGPGVDRISLQLIAEKVRAVGRLTGLEVQAKEIATATKGWDWVPPILLSQAKLAMIFHFEKQYSVDLGRLTPERVVDLGGDRYRLTLPPIEGTLRLMDVKPYDIQQGRVLGLVDVINMNAQRQSELMEAAQVQAADLFERSDPRYMAEAAGAIERQLGHLLSLFGVQVDIVWEASSTTGQPRVQLDDHLKTGAAAGGR